MQKEIEISKKSLSQILIDLDNIRDMLRFIDIDNKLFMQRKIKEDFDFIKKLIKELEEKK